MIVLTVLGRADCHLCEAMIEELAPLGFDEAFVRTILSTEGISVIRLDIVPEFLFDQTPGPGAGQSLVR